MNELIIAAAVALSVAAMPAAAYADGFEPQAEEPSVEAAQVEEPTVETEQASGEEAVLPPEYVSGEEFRYMGVVWFDGHAETFYSSAELYHPDTPSWELDEEGFYRCDGYYVVATDSVPMGSIIATSRGDGIVLDCGCGSNVDFYVDWV